MSYCPNCGNQLDDGEKFCSVCGMQQEQPKRPETNAEIEPLKKKKGSKPVVGIIVGVIIVIAVIGIIVGVVIKNKKPSNKNIMEAFKEYYNEFCEIHYVDDVIKYGVGYEVANYWDCIARVVYLDDEPLLMIADMVGVSGEEDERSDFIYNVYFLSYNGRKVTEKYKINNVYAWDDGFLIYIEDNKLILETEAYKYDSNKGYSLAVYELSDNNMESYLRVLREDDTVIYYELDGNHTNSVDIDNIVEKVCDYDSGIRDNEMYYVFGDWGKMNSHPTYGALNGDKFREYLITLENLESIDSEEQLERVYSECMGYNNMESENTKQEPDKKFDENRYYSGELFGYWSLDGVVGYLDNDGADITCGNYTLSFGGGGGGYYYRDQSNDNGLFVQGYSFSGDEYSDEDMPEYFEKHEEDYYYTCSRIDDVVELINSEGMKVEMCSYIVTGYEFDGTLDEEGKVIIIKMENGLYLSASTLDNDVFENITFEDLLPLTEGWVTIKEQDLL